MSRSCSGTWFLRRRRKDWHIFHDVGESCRCTLLADHKGKHLCKCGGRR
jgi:hypothetical protein